MSVFHAFMQLIRRSSNASRRPRRRPARARMHVERLEDRCLLSSYSLTELGPIGTAGLYANPFGEPYSGINNAASVQVVGQNSADQAYLWSSSGGMQTLGTVATDAESTAMAVNNAGQVVGVSYTLTQTRNKKTGISYLSVSSQHAFLWDPVHGMQNLGTNDTAKGINAAGEVSGTAKGEAAVRIGTTWTLLGTLGGPASVGYGINDYGQVVGFSYLDSTESSDHAFLWTPSTAGGAKGTLVDLGALNNTSGYNHSVAVAVNSLGFVAGTTETPSQYEHAFLWSPTTPNGTSGTMLDLGTLTGGSTYARSINSGGLVAGSADVPSTVSNALSHAVLWQPGTGGSYTLSDLNNLIPTGTGWDLVAADAINDRGQIVVEAVAQGGSAEALHYAFLLTPTTTPATAAPAGPAAGTPTDWEALATSDSRARGELFSPLTPVPTTDVPSRPRPTPFRGTIAPTPPPHAATAPADPRAASSPAVADAWAAWLADCLGDDWVLT